MNNLLYFALLDISNSYSFKWHQLKMKVNVIKTHENNPGIKIAALEKIFGVEEHKYLEY